MAERIHRIGEKRVYQPRISATRIHDLYEVKIFTGRPMTVLIDEALSVYLAAILTSADYAEWSNHIERKVEELVEQEPNTDDWEDLDTYLSRYE